MKAIVLTYDKYHPLTKHMILKYQELWPSNPFTFRVPYQKYPKHIKERFGDKVELIESPKGIKQTVLKLIKDLPDNEWVYWCIDDKYLINIKNEEANRFYKMVLSLNDPKICGISFARSRKFLKTAHLRGLNKNLSQKGKDIFLERKDYQQIWLHQFLRVKVLKHLFNQFPNENFIAKEMDYFKDNLKLPNNQKLLVSEKNYVIFGESTSRGMLTQNCVHSLNQLKLKPPKEFAISGKKIIIGELDEQKNSSFFSSIFKKLQRSSLYCKLARAILKITRPIPEELKRKWEERLNRVIKFI